MLVNSIPGFEFPRVNLYDYVIDTAVKQEDEIIDDDFVLGVVWSDSIDEINEIPQVLVDHSHFNCELSAEEVNILALLMK